MQYKHFIKQQDGKYSLKKKYGFALVITIAFLLLAFTGYRIANTAMIWVGLVIAAICALAFLSKTMVIDMQQKVIIAKNGLINPPVQIALADFENFELEKMQQYFITTNTMLNLYYQKNGKRKSVMIAQGFSTKPMQEIVNELEDIINSHEHSR